VTIGGSAGAAGHDDGNYQNSRFHYPAGVFIHEGHGDIYVADSWNHCIRALSEEGEVRTVAGEPGILGFVDGPQGAQFSCPHDITVDRDGNILVADTDNHCIRKIDTNGVVSTLAGTGGAGHTDGEGGAAEFYSPKGITMDSAGEYCIVSDTGNHCLRRVSPSGLTVTFAGKPELSGFADGEGTEARFCHPMGISVDPTGRYLVADTGNNRVRLVTIRSAVSTLVGDGESGYREGVGTTAAFHGPSGVCACPIGGFVVADTWNHRIRFVSDKRSAAAVTSSATSSIAGLTHSENGAMGEARCTAVELLRKECGRLLQRDDSLAGVARVFEEKLRENYDKQMVEIEKQRQEMEESVSRRRQKADVEMSERRYQCEVECKVLADAQKVRIEAVMEALERLGPDEIAAAADARNMRLRAEIERLKKDLDQVTLGATGYGGHTAGKGGIPLNAAAATKDKANFIDGLLSFESPLPARNPEESPFDPMRSGSESAAKLAQLRVQKQIRELEELKQLCIQDEDFIRADEIKEEIRKMKKKHVITADAPRAIVTVTHIKILPNFVTKFAGSWQEPPRTRLLQDTVDESVFIMYEAHPKRQDADAFIGMADNAKWGEVAAWLAEPTKTHVFTAVNGF